MLARPPIVGVLGHVNHGKTSLIAKIKESDLTRQEAGGISQHLGVYQVEYKKQKITLIDTPGHEAFVQMRSRGARVADLIILVVAANEGVKAQTLESWRHIVAAKVPFLVAITKMDLPGAEVNKVKTDLAAAGILVEGYGGKIVAVPVSAKSGEGLDELLEIVLLLAEMQEIKADPEAKLEAVVIEAKKDARRGIVASLVIRNGSLHLADEVEIEGVKSRVKMLLDDQGQRLTVARPGQPVEVLGLVKLPSVGAEIGSQQKRKKTEKKEEGDQKLKIILKADGAGTLEAVRGSLRPEIKVISAGVGAVNDSEVLWAKSVAAEIVGFNIKVTSGVAKLAATEGVKIKTFSLIYDLLDYLKKRLVLWQQPGLGEEVLGEAEILAQFEMKEGRILGARVIKGEIEKTHKIRLKRAGVVVGEARLKSLKKDKMDILRVKKDQEFGAILTPAVDFQVGDLVISYRDGSE